MQLCSLKRKTLGALAKAPRNDDDDDDGDGDEDGDNDDDDDDDDDVRTNIY